MSDQYKASRTTPPETPDDWRYLWRGAEKAHAGWFVVKVQMAIFGNWKVLLLGVVAGAVMGGGEVLRAWGVWK
jgi:hypothetical protein